MKSSGLTITFFWLCGVLFAQDLSVKDLTLEHKKNPVGIDITQPRFSWKIYGTGVNIMQSAIHYKGCSQ